ncbi:penicillin-binding protein, partial [Agrobacterium vitis]
MIETTRIKDQQYFPTYHLSKEATEVALKEYDLAASTLASEGKVLNMSTSVLLGFIGVAAAFYKDNAVRVEGALKNGIESTHTLAAFVIVFVLLTLASTSYFADTRRSVVLSSRKIIILRRMLGLSYGHIELVLPNKRIEGANEPYHLRMFHGWISPKAVPVYCLSITSGVLVWLFFPKFQLGEKYFVFGYNFFPIALSFLWGIFVALYYRLHLLDQYESIFRIVSVFTARILRQKIELNFEYIIYRSRLSVMEAKRLGVPVEIFRTILVALEDRAFYKHHGVSLRAIFAAAYRYLKRGKRSGGSTITQQIARTLFLKMSGGSVRRKIVEIFLAVWFDRCFSKNDIIDLYICSVRYERRVNGVIEAFKFFFPHEQLSNVNVSQAFFLIERVSNINSGLIVDKLILNIKYLF